MKATAVGLALLSSLALVACADDGTVSSGVPGADDEQSSSAHGEGAAISSVSSGLTASYVGERPPQTCSGGLAAKNVSTPTSVVGTGSPASCSETALRMAVAKGGVITFKCGSSPVTIRISTPLVAPTDRDTIIDGADRIVLDGGGTTQILRAQSRNFRANDRTLTLQRLMLQNGNDAGAGYVARNGTKMCAWGYKSGGGGAISVRDINLHIWGVVFQSNDGPKLGPDVAGGAIYAVGSKKLVIANSIFRDNQAANGGAVGCLHTSTELHNVIFEGNQATGEGANFFQGAAAGCPLFNHAEQGGAGGLGGAFYSDGFDPGDTFCGVRMSANSSGNLGGALFRSAYDSNAQTITWDRCTFEDNYSTTGGGGAAYLNNSQFTLKGSRFDRNNAGSGDGGGLKLTGLTVYANTVSFTGNKAAWGGGVAHWGGGARGVGTASNVTYSSNTPNNWVGDFPH